MTDRGVPSTAGPNGGSLLTGNSSPSQLETAAKACQRYLPRGGIPLPTHAQILEEEREWLTYAARVRAHGVPNYPDPTIAPGGEGLLIAIEPASGIHVHSPLFQHAVNACRDANPIPTVRSDRR
jgi:hypothetical protein